jgi:hypothetical protein
MMEVMHSSEMSPQGATSQKMAFSKHSNPPITALERGYTLKTPWQDQALMINRVILEINDAATQNCPSSPVIHWTKSSNIGCR